MFADWTENDKKKILILSVIMLTIIFVVTQWLVDVSVSTEFARLAGANTMVVQNILSPNIEPRVTYHLALMAQMFVLMSLVTITLWRIFK